MVKVSEELMDIIGEHCSNCDWEYCETCAFFLNVVNHENDQE